jgi:hypothetical protein
MKALTILTGLFLLIGQPFYSMGQFLTDNLLFTAKLTSDQSTARGVAALTINGSRDTICLSINMMGISDSITGIGLYSTDTDSSGSLVIDFSSVVDGNTLNTSIVGTFVNEENLADFIEGDYSIRVFTNGSTEPLIAGNLRLETDYSFVALINGDQEVPPSGSTAYGLAIVKLNMDSSKMKIDMMVDGLTGSITGVHMHLGGDSVNGPVAVDLTEFVDGKVIQGTVDSSDFLSIVDSLVSGLVYLNVHTGIYPNGEIRGQLQMDKGIAFHSFLTGDQEVPPVSTNAVGLAHVSFNPIMDAVTYHIIAVGLNDSLTGAHLHLGQPGIIGPVIVDLSANDTMDTFILNGEIDQLSIPDTLMQNLLTSNIYINLHTAPNPDGVIRGQMRRYLWEGFTYSMDGIQEIPSVVTSARGGGFAAINPEGSKLHFMLAADHLSDTTTAAHFHAAPAGEEGAAIFTLSPYLSELKDSVTGHGSVFGEGFWDDQSNPALDQAAVSLFTNDSIYINLHTSLAPNGEIRGQVLHGAACLKIVTGIPFIPDAVTGSLVIYPNPVEGMATVSIFSERSEDMVMKLYDLQGRLLLTKEIKLPSGNSEQYLDLSAYLPGIYFVEVRSNSQSLVRKLEKQ